MSEALDIANVAALVGDPSRANMLAAMIDGRAYTAGELADMAGVTPATASAHLARLAEGHLVTPTAQGRHRYFRLASEEVADMLEGIMVVAGAAPPDERRATPRVPAALKEARSCYDHLAGRIAVALADRLVETGAIALDRNGAAVTDRGRAMLTDFGVTLAPTPGSRRPLCKPCLDWSERRPHLAGTLGAQLLDRFLALHWLERIDRSRALRITPADKRGFGAAFGLN